MTETTTGGIKPPTRQEEALIAKHMALLRISRDEAIQLIADDKRIDRGEKLFELDDELKSGAKKARTMPRGTYNFTPRERKQDSDKRELMDRIVGGLSASDVSNLDITNPERELTFTFNGKKYKVTLSAPRS